MFYSTKIRFAPKRLEFVMLIPTLVMSITECICTLLVDNRLYQRLDYDNLSCSL